MNLRKEPELIRQEALLSEIEIQERVIVSYEKAVYENIGQILSLAKMQLHAIDLEKTAESQTRISHSGKLIGKAIHDLRHMTKQLGVKEIMDKGFAFAVEYELERIQYSKECLTKFSLSGPFFKLEGSMELIAFSILQELILDILLERVSRLTVKLRYSANKISIRLLHQSTAKSLPVKGLIKGHVKMNNRLKLIKARLAVKTVAGNGIIFIGIKK